jgi:hypothetical protein
VHGILEVFANPAAQEEWRIRLRIWWIGYFRRFRSGSGSLSFLIHCALAWLTIRNWWLIFIVYLCKSGICLFAQKGGQ